MMKAVQELRQSRDSDSPRAMEFSENILDTVERVEINQTSGNRNV